MGLFQAPKQDGSCRVVVTVELGATLTGVPAFVKLLVNDLTTATAQLAGHARVHKQHNEPNGLDSDPHLRFLAQITGI